MFTSMKDLIGDVAKQLGLTQWAEVQEIAATYGKIVPERVLKATRVTSLRQGKLEIEVFTGPLLMELSQYQRPKILKQLQAEHPQVRDIHFRSARST